MTPYTVPVTVWKEGDEYVAAQNRCRVHAFGETPNEAVCNLAIQMREQLARLDALGDRVSRHVARQREHLRRIYRHKEIRYEPRPAA